MRPVFASNRLRVIMNAMHYIRDSSVIEIGFGRMNGKELYGEGVKTELVVNAILNFLY